MAKHISHGQIPVLTEASILFSLMSTEDILKEQIKAGDMCVAAISGGIRLFVWDIWKDVSQAPWCARDK